MSQEFTFIGSMLVASSIDCYLDFCDLEMLLEVDPYDSLTITDTPEGRLFDIFIAGADVSPRYAVDAHNAIVAFTTKHGLEGAVFKIGQEEDDIICLGPHLEDRRKAHILHLKEMIALLQIELFGAEDADLIDYEFDHERPPA